MRTSFTLTARIAALLFATTLCVACSDDDGGEVTPDAGQPDQLLTDTQVTPDLKPDAPAVDEDLRKLASMMTGRFSSEKQSKADLSYLHVNLDMKRIWPERDQGTYWLYIEQAMAGSKPYRQRVYQLERIDTTTIVSKVFDFLRNTDKTAAIGAWQQQEPLKNLSPADLVEKTGCGVIMKKEADGSFKGSTDGKKCLSNYGGAAYATSEVTVAPAEMTSWDRGYSAADQQVWGAVTGAYIFDKLSNLDADLD